eukprot:jgi/Bigna1/145105/aug1.95_g19813
MQEGRTIFCSFPCDLMSRGSIYRKSKDLILSCDRSLDAAAGPDSSVFQYRHNLFGKVSVKKGTQKCKRNAIELSLATGKYFAVTKWNGDRQKSLTSDSVA